MENPDDVMAVPATRYCFEREIGTVLSLIFLRFWRKSHDFLWKGRSACDNLRSFAIIFHSITQLPWGWFSLKSYGIRY